MDTKCPKCDSEGFEIGVLQGFRAAAFLPKSTKFLSLETSEIPTSARMCRNCGLIEIIGDVEKLTRLSRKEDR